MYSYWPIPTTTSFLWMLSLKEVSIFFFFCVVGLFFYKAHFICYVSSCMLTNVRLCVCVICRVISVKISLSRDITISCIHQISTTEMFSTLNSKISIVLEKGFFGILIYLKVNSKMQKYKNKYNNMKYIRFFDLSRNIKTSFDFTNIFNFAM